MKNDDPEPFFLSREDAHGVLDFYWDRRISSLFVADFKRDEFIKTWKTEKAMLDVEHFPDSIFLNPDWPDLPKLFPKPD